MHALPFSVQKLRLNLINCASKSDDLTGTRGLCSLSLSVDGLKLCISVVWMGVLSNTTRSIDDSVFATRVLNGRDSFVVSACKSI